MIQIMVNVVDIDNQIKWDNIPIISNSKHALTLAEPGGTALPL